MVGLVPAEFCRVAQQSFDVECLERSYTDGVATLQTPKNICVDTSPVFFGLRLPLQPSNQGTEKMKRARCKSSRLGT
jgi:hypothetical protein